MEVRSPVNIPVPIKKPTPEPNKYTIFVRPELDQGYCGDVLLNACEILGAKCKYPDPVELIIIVISKTSPQVGLEISVPLSKDVAETKLAQLLPMEQFPQLYCSCGNRMLFNISEANE